MPSRSRRAGADRSASAAAAEVDRSAVARRERLGTGHGERETSVVTHVDFERASQRPDLLLQIRYDRIENLVAAGIAPQNWASLNPHALRPPRPFPADPGAGYVPDPPAR